MKMLKGPVVLATLGVIAAVGAPADHSYAQTPGVVVVQPNQSVYTYPEGRYELRGEGTSQSPYYWAWIPTGTQSVIPPPPQSSIQTSQRPYASPPPPPSIQAGQRVYGFPGGRYELLGNGTAGSPYYWVWIPAGVQFVPAPPPALGSVQAGQTVSPHPAGRYELRGDGTAANPYYWVWVPAAATVASASGPRYGLDSELKSAEGKIEFVGSMGRSIRLDDGQEFEVPDASAMSNLPRVGEEVVVKYYVAPDGRNVVSSLDRHSAK